MKKRLAVGNSSFALMMQEGCYYVDKTSFIKPIMESGNFVELITRPRRFGKTLFLDMLRAFLSADSKTAYNQADLFKDLAVTQDKAFCTRFMGKKPVLFLSLKSVEGQNFSEACCNLADLIAITADEYSFLLESSRLTKAEKRRLEAYINLSFADADVGRRIASKFLRDMLIFLAKFYGEPAVLLIDEYDVPLAKASAGGYYDEMCAFIRTFLSVLKPEDLPLIGGLPVLGKAVLTGCLRVSKESIFTGVNNFSVNSVCTEDETFAAAIGFTASEVSSLLSYCGMNSRMGDVKHWYDGYRLGSEEIFCPWDVLNFCQFALKSKNPQSFQPGNYWSGTSGNSVIDEFLGFLSDEDADRMQQLLDGGEIELRINEQLTYADFGSHRSDDFWTLLLFTGYLTVAKYLGKNLYRLRIPNEEIRQTFRERVQMRFSGKNASFAQFGMKLADAALSGEAAGMTEVLEQLLRNYVSVRDATSRAPAENYYHGFLSALFACAGSRIQDFASNPEADDGYADIIFTSGSGSQRIGVIIEIKRVSRVEDLRRAAAEALRQIDARRYVMRLDNMRCSRRYVYGIAFCGKHCEVGGGDIANSVKGY